MIAIFDNEYAFLSNFYESPFEVDGITYPTVEHFFQAMKSKDIEGRKKIAAAPTPGKAKRLGRTIELRKDWEEIKVAVMKFGLAQKFRIPELREKLLATGNEELIEGNFWHDNVWGNCLCAECQDIPGRNMLGMLLMKVREEILYEEANK